MIYKSALRCNHIYYFNQQSFHIPIRCSTISIGKTEIRKYVKKTNLPTAPKLFINNIHNKIENYRATKRKLSLSPL